MCGIAGFTRFHQKTGDLDTLKAMGQTIYHRGPDAGGEYLDNQVGLCHRRLSIIDLSEVGNQPMYYDDEQLVIVFNGEIYNFQDLRNELLAQGYKFQTGTDTEVLLALYQRDGEELLQHINGMFAFAIWDKVRQTLFLARDRLGKKPLYFYNKSGSFVFASELKAILTLTDLPRNIRSDAVYDYFTYQYVPEPKTIFEDIYKLEPGHSLIVTSKGITKKQYWNLSFHHVDKQNTETAALALLENLQRSTKQRMISDVPLGAFLSGGVDSSGIVGLMADNSSQPITTCSIGFDSKKYDEVAFAKQVADRYHSNHHEYTVKENVAANLENIVRYFDEPFADPSLVPTYFVAKLARQQVTVALAGDGGDECFAGYEKYAIDAFENRLRHCFPTFIRKHLFSKCASLLARARHPLFRKAHTLFKTLSHSPGYGFFLSNAFFRESIWNDIITSDFKQRLGHYHPSEITLKHYNQADGPDHLARILYTDFKTYLPGDILVKVDRMSMANSLEVRAPILDYKVVEQAARMPSKLKFKKGDKKHILKQTFKKHLSDDILYRKKMGFSVPLADWLRHEIKSLAENTLFGSQHGLPDYFDMKKIKDLWDLHQRQKADYSQELWSMLIFQLWHNNYVSNPT